MEWLSSAWSSIGFYKSSSASYVERRRTEYDVVKHQFLVRPAWPPVVFAPASFAQSSPHQLTPQVAVHTSLADAVVRSDPEFAGVLRWILAWEQSRYEYSETEYARLLRMIDNFNGELEHFLKDRGGAARLVAREIAGYYSLEGGGECCVGGGGLGCGRSCGDSRRRPCLVDQLEQRSLGIAGRACLCIPLRAADSRICRFQANRRTIAGRNPTATPSPVPRFQADTTQPTSSQRGTTQRQSWRA